MKDILERLAEFIKKVNEASWPKNKWIEDEDMRVYVRKSKRLIYTKESVAKDLHDMRLTGGVETDRPMLTALDIANIEVDPTKLRQGLFSEFVRQAHEMHPWDLTYIESISNEIVEHWCIKNNWKQQVMAIPPSYYKMKERKD